MDALLVLIPPPVGDDATVEYVELADGPGVKPRLSKHHIERRIISDLHVAAAESKAANTQSAGDGAKIVVMKYPALSRDAALETRDCKGDEFSRITCDAIAHWDCVGEGSLDRPHAVNKDVKVSSWKDVS
jgi:hypothetical protein